MKVHFIQQDSWVLPGGYRVWAERHGFRHLDIVKEHYQWCRLGFLNMSAY